MAIKVSGDTVINDNKLFLPNNSAEASTSLTITSGSITVDLNQASVFNLSLTSSITNFQVTNIQLSGRASSFLLVITYDGTIRTIVWPVSFRWPNETAPTLSSESGKKDIFVFFTDDGGTNWQSFISAQNI